MDKRTFIKNSAFFGGAVLLSKQLVAAEKVIKKIQAPAFSLDALPYKFDALEPFFDKMTMEIHYSKHHQAYVNNLNKAVEGTDLVGNSVENILKNVSQAPVVVRNNAGGHYNHTFFWNILSPNTATKRTEKLATAIDKKFNSFDLFKVEFTKVAMNRFGSGWAWLVLNESKELQIYSSPNQDNPLMDISEVKGAPLMALDVWEHAYYLKYQNKRADYVAAFWNVVNWEEVSKKYENAVK
ncbi:MAG: superoxide dismutase [Cytophagales bacterium]